MGQIRDTANIVYADGPTSNPTQPLKSDIRELFEVVEGVTDSLQTAIDDIGVPTVVIVPKDPVACATTANITLSGEQTIDGVATSASRVLVKNQSSPAQNGIYVSAAGAWARAADMNASDEFVGARALVLGGTANGGKTFACANTSAPTVGTTAVTFVYVSDQNLLDSPTLTGTPTAPTAPDGTDTTQVATTEFVQDALGPLNIGRGDPRGRPGAVPEAYFESNAISSAGGPETALANIDPARLVTGAAGEVVRVAAVTTRAFGARWPQRIEAGHFYEVRFVARRISDPANPATSIVTFGVRWLDANYAEVAGSPFASEVITDLVVAHGARERSYIVGRDWIPPSSAVYFRPYVQIIGLDQTTDIEIIDWRDLTKVFGLVERIIGPKSGRISVLGDSLSQVLYALPTKAWPCVLSNLSDWQFANFSLAGDDTLELWQRVVNSVEIYGDWSYRDHEPQYVLIPLFANDANVRAAGTRLFVENFRRLIKTVRSQGGIPVVVTEGRKERGIEKAALSRLARDVGALYWEISGEYFSQDATRNNDYWYQNHPGTRGTVQYADAIRRRLPELGRPDTGYKVFRPRYYRQLFGPIWSWSCAGGTTRAMPSATNNGTLVGSATIVSDTIRGSVVEQTANGDRMTIGGAPAMPASYTFVDWINPASIGSARNLFAGFTAGRLSIRLHLSSRIIVSHAGTDYIDYTSDIAADGTWRHVAVTYDAVQDALVLYLDGVQVASAAGVPGHACTDPQIGASGTGSSFLGKWDDLHVYDKVLQPWQVAVLAQHRDGLLYENNDQRHALWQEIEIGHNALVSGDRQNFDTLGALSPATHESHDSEYLTLQNGGGVVFRDKALIQFIVPATANKTVDLRLRFKGAPNAAVYFLSRQPLIPVGGNAANKSKGFNTADDLPGLNVSATYTDGSNTFTVNGSTLNKDGPGNVVWCFPETSIGDTGPGTLTRTSGLGPNTINYSETINFADAAYYDAVDRPYARWVSASGLGAANLGGTCRLRMDATKRQIVDYDTVTVLIEQKGAFTLSNIDLVWLGVPNKDNREAPRPRYRAGTELLTSTKFDGLVSSDWTTVGTVVEAVPADGVLPYGATKTAIVSKVNKLRQNVTIEADPLLPKLFQVRARVRFAPPKAAYASYNELLEISPITIDTPDFAYVVLSIDNGTDRYAVVAKEMVMLSSTDVLVEFEIPNQRDWEATSCRLTISAMGPFGDDIQIEPYEASFLDCGPVEAA